MLSVFYQVRKYIVVAIALVSIVNLGAAQNCFDADFESGSVGGYTAYHGEIDNEGNLTFPFVGTDSDQHKIMSVEDGFDPIANLYCIENKQLPVSGQGTGKYSLRLGDSFSGARTSKVVLSFDVAPNVSFFLLKYAVVLEDPMHDHFEQPRFEMYIKDQAGDVLDCGEYTVRAAENIPGFETCGVWRVRPWTTAGFELQSYIGQTINIEIISTDCSRGGHGGYAYIDATCKPLELILDSYCPDSSFARYYVTEGFDTYDWNTGDNTNIIEIENAMPGNEYSVTVTSSTGCTLVLRDTLPEIPNIVDIEFSYFDGPDTLHVCHGEEISYTPSGTNLGIVEALELGYSAESFQMFVNYDRSVRFVTRDNFGCLYDTMTLELIVHDIEVDIEDYETCLGESNGSIVINNIGEGTLITSIENSAFTSDMTYENLAPGAYRIRVRNEQDCEYVTMVIINSVNPPTLNQINITAASCGLDNGLVIVSSFDNSVEYSLDGADFTTDNSWNELAGGTYSLMYKNSIGCLSTKDIIVPQYDAPVLSVTSTDLLYCGASDGVITCTATGGQEPLLYSVEGNFDAISTFNNLAAGEYMVLVRDESNCMDTTIVNIASDPYVTIENVISTPANCEKDNGAIEIVLQNEEIGYDLFIENESATSLYVDGLSAGTYALLVEDDNGCTDSYSHSIEIIPSPQILGIEYKKGECGDNAITAIVNASSGTDGIFYSANYNPPQSSKEIEMIHGDNYVYIVDDFGCEIDTSIVLPDVEQYSLANIFSPNEDGHNDLFCFHNINGISHIEHIYVFDRWGNRVYALEGTSTQNDDLCWDGKYNNQNVATGVYVYHLQARLVDGRLLCKAGDVTVI